MTLVEQIIYDDELSHYGVLGMKWGVRKTRPTSQKTGSSDDIKKNIIQPRSSNLSKASTKSIIDSNNRRSAQERQAINKAKVVRNTKGDILKRLSDADLTRSISRMQQERQYRELNQSFTQKLIKEIGREVTKRQVVNILNAGVSALIANSLSGTMPSNKISTDFLTDLLKK